MYLECLGICSYLLCPYDSFLRDILAPPLI